MKLYQINERKSKLNEKVAIRKMKMRGRGKERIRMTEWRTGGVKKLSQRLHWNAKRTFGTIIPLSDSFTSSFILCVTTLDLFFLSLSTSRCSSLFNPLHKHLRVSVLRHTHMRISISFLKHRIEKNAKTY